MNVISLSYFSTCSTWKTSTVKNAACFRETCNQGEVRFSETMGGSMPLQGKRRTGHSATFGANNEWRVKLKGN